MPIISFEHIPPQMKCFEKQYPSCLKALTSTVEDTDDLISSSPELMEYPDFNFVKCVESHDSSSDSINEITENYSSESFVFDEFVEIKEFKSEGEEEISDAMYSRSKPADILDTNPTPHKKLKLSFVYEEDQPKFLDSSQDESIIPMDNNRGNLLNDGRTTIQTCKNQCAVDEGSISAISSYTHTCISEPTVHTTTNQRATDPRCSLCMPCMNQNIPLDSCTTSDKSSLSMTEDDIVLCETSIIEAKTQYCFNFLVSTKLDVILPFFINILYKRSHGLYYGYDSTAFCLVKYDGILAGHQYLIYGRLSKRKFYFLNVVSVENICYKDILYGVI